MGAPLNNKNAVKGNRLVTDVLIRVVTQNPNKIRKAVEKLLDKAEEGDIAAFREIYDRLEGKPAQCLTLAGDSDNPVEIVNKVEIVPLGNSTDSDT